MTLAELEQAKNIQAQIASIDKILENLSYTYACEPPTRMTSWCLTSSRGGNQISITLLEGEVVAFTDALESKKACLLREFERL